MRKELLDALASSTQWLAFLGGILLFVLSLVSRRVREPRLFLRVSLHEDEDGSRRGQVVRLLVHNAEPTMKIENIEATFRAPDDATSVTEESLPVLAYAGPTFDAQVEIRKDKHGVSELHLRSNRDLKPGRSWLFQFNLPSAFVSGIRAIVLYGDGYSRAVTAKRASDAANDDDDSSADTLNQAIFFLLPTITVSVATAAAGMLWIIDPQSTAEAIGPLVVLLVVSILVVAVLYPVLRPNRPYVAVGYKTEDRFPRDFSVADSDPPVAGSAQSPAS